jgi:hypothetical protein
MVPDSPTETTDTVELVISSSLLLLQEMKMELKRRRKERIMSRCFTWFPIGGLGEPYMYHDLDEFTRIGDYTWRVSDCEELVGVSYRGMMGFHLKGRLLFHSI